VEFVILGVAVVLVVAVGLVFTGDAVGKTSAMPDQVVVDATEAIDFCAEALPGEVTATLTFDELRRILRLHLEWIQAFHWAPANIDEGPIVFEQLDALDYVAERADVVGLGVSRAHIAAVIEAHSAYLQVMGAIHLEDPVQVEADLSELPVGSDVPVGELASGPDAPIESDAEVLGAEDEADEFLD